MQDVVVLMHEGVAHLRRTRAGPPTSTAHESSQRGSSGRARPRRWADRGDGGLTTCAGGGDPDAAAGGAEAAAGGGGGGGDAILEVEGLGFWQEVGRGAKEQVGTRERGGEEAGFVSLFPQSWREEGKGGAGGCGGGYTGTGWGQWHVRAKRA